MELPALVAVRILLYLFAVNIIVKLSMLQPMRLRWLLICVALHLFGVALGIAVETNHRALLWWLRDFVQLGSAILLIFVGLEALFGFTRWRG